MVSGLDTERNIERTNGPRGPSNSPAGADADTVIRHVRTNAAARVLWRKCVCRYAQSGFTFSTLFKAIRWDRATVGKLESAEVTAWNLQLASAMRGFQ